MKANVVNRGMVAGWLRTFQHTDPSALEELAQVISNRCACEHKTSVTAAVPAGEPSLPGGGSEEGTAPISAEEVEREAERLFEIYRTTPPCSPHEWHEISWRPKAGWHAVAKDKLEVMGRLRAIGCAQIVEDYDVVCRELRAKLLESQTEARESNAQVGVLSAKLEEAERRIREAKRGKAAPVSQTALEPGRNRCTAEAYAKLIAEDIAWLEKQPRSLERDHIRVVLETSPATQYPHDFSPPAWTPKQREAWNSTEIEAVRATFAAVENLSTCGPRQLTMMAAKAWLDAGKDEGGRT